MTYKQQNLWNRGQSSVWQFLPQLSLQLKATFDAEQKNDYAEEIY